ncbi:hypothetical protein [Nonomuraea endophytica]|uniref:Uncharacterized protein n=1 Tax=Nonomuraea endophytica TaxID=714136 RepID=A0A7W8EIG2_9ACTN|nr:hypothetical protein [Nonomuraea endophytica]MBB5081985.1 hypothetical protein [Nonomuraea endophytica]
MSWYKLALSVSALTLLTLGTAACGSGGSGSETAAVADTKGCKEMQAVMGSTVTELQKRAGDLEAMKQLYSDSAEKIKGLDVDAKAKDAQAAVVSLYEELSQISTPEEADEHTDQATATVSKLNSACAA